MKYYSPSTQGFYDKDVHDVIPEDSVEITDEYWESLLGSEISFDGEKPIIKIYTDEEIVQQELQAKVNEAQQYLTSTDHKFFNGYKPKQDEDLVAIEAKRDEARDFIRNNKV